MSQLGAVKEKCSTAQSTSSRNRQPISRAHHAPYVEDLRPRAVEEREIPLEALRHMSFAARRQAHLRIGQQQNTSALRIDCVPSAFIRPR